MSHWQTEISTAVCLDCDWRRSGTEVNGDLVSPLVEQHVRRKGHRVEMSRSQSAVVTPSPARAQVRTAVKR